MLQDPFFLNDRYSVHPRRNLVSDAQSGAETRLEPRVMDVLCLLAARQGEVVSRETFTATIWKDYGGADDGLNQGISFLRKVIGDVDKKIIETVPKKGYILHGAVAVVRDAEPRAELRRLPAETVTETVALPSRRASRTGRYWLFACLLLLVVAAVFYWQSARESSVVPATPTGQKRLAPLETLQPLR